MRDISLLGCIQRCGTKIKTNKKQGRVLLGLEFYVGLTYPFFAQMLHVTGGWWTFQFLVVPLLPCGMRVLDHLLACTLVLALM